MRRTLQIDRKLGAGDMGGSYSFHRTWWIPKWLGARALTQTGPGS